MVRVQPDIPHTCIQSRTRNSSRCVRVVNLSLHGIGKPARELLSPGEGKWWLSLAVFKSIMDVISEYNNVRLSIDDGNISDVEIILPELLKHDMKANFFILAGKIDVPGYLSREGIQRLAESEMLIGTHGMHHHNWRFLNDEELAKELLMSKDILEQVAGQQVLQAAIPFGAYDRRVLRHLRAVGFERVYTSDTGLARDHTWLQPRTSLLATDSSESIKEIIHQPLFGGRAFVREIKKAIKWWR